MGKPTSEASPTTSSPGYEQPETYPPINAAYTTPSNVAYPPPSGAANPFPRNAAYPPSTAAYPPSDATTYPPSMPVAFPPPGQQLPGYGGNPGSVPVKFPPENYPPAPAFHHHPSVAAAPSAGYPVQHHPPVTPGRYVPQGNSPWTTGIFDCMEDPTNGNDSAISLTETIFHSSLWKRELTHSSALRKLLAAVMTFLLPCFTFGQIAEILDEGRSST